MNAYTLVVRLVRVCQASLGLMLVSGATLVFIVRGAFAHQKWMQVSFPLFMLLGVGTGLVQRYFKKALSSSSPIPHLERAHRLLLVMCGIVGVIAWLMQSKPF